MISLQEYKDYTEKFDKDSLYTVSDIARTGLMSRPTIYKMIDDGSIKFKDFSRPGSKQKNILIPGSELLRYVNEYLCAIES